MTPAPLQLTIACHMALSGEALALLGDLESFRAERTESLTNTDKFCKAICALANDMPGSGLPGYLFVGVDKKGVPNGAKIDERVLEQLAGYRDNGNIIPIPDMHVVKDTHGGCDIAIVIVRPSDMPPVRYKQVVWIRTGPSEDRATAEQERRLEERRVDRARTWDTLPVPTLRWMILHLICSSSTICRAAWQKKCWMPMLDRLRSSLAPSAFTTER